MPANFSESRAEPHAVWREIESRSRNSERSNRRLSVPAGKRIPQNSDPAPFWRPAAVMRDRGDVADRRHGEPDGLQRAQCRFAPGAGSLDLDLERAHA